MPVDPLQEAIASLSDRQREYVGKVVAAVSMPIETTRNPDSDFVTPEFAEAMADVLRAHHVASTKPLGKEHFEHAMAGLLVELGHAAELSPMGFPGADIVVDDVPWSFKTEAAQSIRPDVVHISKFMELGKGQWVTEDDLAGLRDRMLDHLKGYDRILDLRYLSGARSRRDQGEHEYELLEIPKSLLQSAAGADCVMMHDSRQSPKPGYCRVYDPEGELNFELYFDGGTERKLQVRKLRVDLCTVHATWKF